MKDFTIIGAGYAGVSTGALLAKQGFSVQILEAHSLIGGCASYFRRKHFLFDAGATTLSGVLPGQPLGKLFNDLNIQPELKKLEIGMTIKMEKETITRYSNLNEWIEEAEKCFPESRKIQKKFWNKIYSINNSAWDFIADNDSLPPRSLSDLFKLAKPSNWTKINLLPGLFFPLRSLLNSLDCKDAKFEKFLEEQLLITTQTTIDKAPILTSAMGLAYPSETYYPIGGITKPLELILNKFIELGGTLTLKENVNSINYEKNNIIVKTEKGNEYSSKFLVSTIPIWNMKSITNGKIQKYYTKLSNKFPEGPGAFTINFGINSSSTLKGGYYQIHTEEKIPECEAGAFFLTLSEIGDTIRAKEGSRTVTISTHTNALHWENLNEDDYELKKQKITEYILNKFDSVFPEFKDSEKLFLLSGSPRTFQKFTKRFRGYVGGIPHSTNPSLLLLPANRTPFRGIFQGGDTAFPGQGTPAVVKGAYQILNYSKYLE